MSGEWDAVAEAIKARMIELRMIQADLVRASGVSATSIRQYLRGGPMSRPDVKWGIAAALKWPPDAIDRIALGQDPANFEPISEVACPCPKDPPWPDGCGGGCYICGGRSEITSARVLELADEVERLRDRVDELEHALREGF